MSDLPDIQDLLRGRHRLRARWPDLKQLSIDFDFDGDAAEVYTGDEECPHPDALVDAWASQAPDNFNDLTDELIAYAHWLCLHWHLNAFAHARSEAMRNEALDWICNRPQFEWCERDLARVDPVRIPFSFDLCCLLEEVDPEALRAAILNLNLKLQGKPLRRRPHVSSPNETESSSTP